MPNVSGDAFVRQLRQISSLPVIVVTGMAEAEEEYSGLDVTFLHKPCPPEDLIRNVRMAMRASA
jgi:DNA-binding response OmpR family regulator